MVNHVVIMMALYCLLLKSHREARLVGLFVFLVHFSFFLFFFNFIIIYNKHRSTNLINEWQVSTRKIYAVVSAAVTDFLMSFRNSNSMPFKMVFAFPRQKTQIEGKGYFATRGESKEINGFYFHR